MAGNTNKPSFQKNCEVVNVEMSQTLNGPVLLHHKRCGNTWIYKGNNPFCTSCSFCKGTVSIRKNKVTQAPQNLEDKTIGVEDHLSVVRVSSPEQHDDGINHLKPTRENGVSNDPRERRI
jgi:hypothetical protein